MERQQPSYFCNISFRDSYDGDYDRGCSNSTSNSGSSSRHEEGERSVRETESRFTSEAQHTDYRSSFRDEMRLAEEERESGWKRIGDVAFGVAETVAVSAVVASGPLGGAIAGAYLGGKACYELYGVYSTTNSASDYGKVVASNAVSAACIFAPGSYLKSIGSSIGRGAAKVVAKVPSAVKSVVSSIGSSICSMGSRAKSWVGFFFPSAAKGATKGVAENIAHGNSGFLGKKGFQLKNPRYQPTRNNPAIINGRQYSNHALDQMQNRGIMPSVVENTLSTGKRSIDPFPGRTRYYEPINNITVITEEGKIIATYYGER